jgi:hypothetical protein
MAYEICQRWRKQQPARKKWRRKAENNGVVAENVSRRKRISLSAMKIMKA